MLKWEYIVLTLTIGHPQTEKILNEHGQNGWELVTINGFNGVSYIMKRQFQAKQTTAKK